MSGSLNDWEVLRRSARQLENELDSKLNTFGQLSSQLKGKSEHSVLGEFVPLISAAQDAFEGSYEEQTSLIFKLLTSLKDTIDRMESHCPSTLQEKQSTAMRLIQRHRETFRDYTAEYNKIRNSIHAALVQSQLLHKCPSSTSFVVQTANGSSPLEVESKSIDSSTVLIEEQIDVARRTRETLLNQRANLESVQSKLSTLASKKLSNYFMLVFNMMFFRYISSSGPHSMSHYDEKT